MRIGIIKLSALGDIIVAMSFLPYLVQKGAKIDWFVDSAFEGIVQDSPYIHQLFSIPLKAMLKQKNLKQLYTTCKTLSSLEKYDLLIDMQGLMKSAILGKFIPKEDFRGFDFGSCKESFASLFYTQKVKIAYEENILKRNAVLLNLPVMDKPMNALGYSSCAKQRIQTLLPQSCKNVLLLLEASKPQKMYPIENFIKLCQSLSNEKIAFFVLYHQHRDLAKELCLKTGATLLPKLSLDEVKALVHQVDGVIGGDTGITHLAWAMNRPSITLYGNTPLRRFELKGEKNISLSGNPLANYDKRDFSIGNIHPLEIKKHLLEIL